MSGIRRIEKHYSVLAARGAFACEDCYSSVPGGAYVIGGSRVNRHSIGELGVRRIRDIVCKQLVRDRRHVSHVANDPLFGGLELFEWRTADYFKFALGIARGHRHRSKRLALAN